MKAIYKACALAVFGLACAIPAQAAEGNEATHYIGASFGRTRVNDEAPAGYTSDKSGTGYKVYAGLKVATELAVEAVWFDFGDSSRTRTLGNVKTETSITAYGAGLAFKPAISHGVFGIGRAGLAQVRSKSAGKTDSNIRAYVGLGAGYAITPQLDVQATWDFLQADIAGEGRRADLFGIGLSYGF